MVAAAVRLDGSHNQLGSGAGLWMREPSLITNVSADAMDEKDSTCGLIAAAMTILLI
jgi:hypothetical protein